MFRNVFWSETDLVLNPRLNLLDIKQVYLFKPVFVMCKMGKLLTFPQGYCALSGAPGMA